MLDVVSVGNATIDVFIHMKGKVSKGNLLLPLGSKQEVESIFYATGGGATNTAAGFKRLGFNTGVLAAVGNDPGGKFVLQELRRHKVNTKMVAQLPEFNTAYSAILTGFGGDRIILTHGGATTHLGEERQVRWGLLGKARWLHISSFHSEPVVLKKILGFAESKGIGVSFNPGKSELEMGMQELEPLLKKVDLLLLNRKEAGSLTKRKKVKGMLERLQEAVPLVAVTEDKKGAHAFDGSSYYYKPTYGVKIADTTGAGDAFHCGFVAARLGRMPVEKAMDWGTANAHSVIMHPGAKNNLLSRQGMKRFLEEHETSKSGTRVEKKH